MEAARSAELRKVVCLLCACSRVTTAVVSAVALAFALRAVHLGAVFAAAGPAICSPSSFRLTSSTAASRVVTIAQQAVLRADAGTCSLPLRAFGKQLPAPLQQSVGINRRLRPVMERMPA